MRRAQRVRFGGGDTPRYGEAKSTHGGGCRVPGWEDTAGEVGQGPSMQTCVGGYMCGGWDRQEFPGVCPWGTPRGSLCAERPLPNPLLCTRQWGATCLVCPIVSVVTGAGASIYAFITSFPRAFVHPRLAVCFPCTRSVGRASARKRQSLLSEPRASVGPGNPGPAVHGGEIAVHRKGR